MNKSPLKLPEFVILFALITSITALSIDAMLPALPQISADLAISDPLDSQLIISLFIFGMVFGELFIGPVSDAIGRKGAILLGVGIYVGGTLVAMTASSFEILILGRIIQGVGASGPKIATRALIRDQYEGESMARIMSFIMVIFIMIPMIAPAFGQMVLAVAEWRYIFFSFLVLSVSTGLWLIIRQPETLARENRIPLSPKKLMHSTSRILKHGKVMCYSVSGGMIFGALLVYVSTSQSIFEDLYGVVDNFPLYFAVLASAVALSSLINSQLVMRFGMHRMVVVALSALIFFTGTLFFFALPHDGIPPFTIFMINGFLIFLSVGILFGNINAMAMQSLGKMAGLGASVIASISSLVAVAVSVSAGRLYDGTVMHMVFALCFCGVTALILVLIAKRSKAGILLPA
ncbi:MFS transporter [Kiloniella litopenaei]|uniref:MFS transporter n=1 Tax=Kiloniella litopenaei TaxID=1549748 RepID=A0A0M2R939_9PROT|nr:multidrug effflux MFS transporter [Kiloniella litopenaei]KKJ78166.1 MFS transporter [Kiloniella litopenaei]